MTIVSWEFESPPLHFIVVLQAEIAQLVEHNLAKVGVAGPSPVFRSTLNVYHAAMVELVDTRDLKSLGQ